MDVFLPDNLSSIAPAGHAPITGCIASVWAALSGNVDWILATHGVLAQNLFNIELETRPGNRRALINFPENPPLRALLSVVQFPLQQRNSETSPTGRKDLAECQKLRDKG